MSRAPVVMLLYESSSLVCPSYLCRYRSRVGLDLGSSGELSVGSLFLTLCHLVFTRDCKVVLLFPLYRQYLESGQG